MFRLSLLAGTAAALLPQGVSAQVAAPAPAPANDADNAAGAAAPAAPSAGTAGTAGTADTDAQPTAPSGRPADYHAQESQEIVVTGYARPRADILSGSSVVSGDLLAREQRPTIGDTLARLPGVSATSFGPNASRPVLRGFQGDRVRILTDGIGSLDVSSASADHAVSINPLTADRIEVLRGPAALLFGSSAIGGVVNVVDSRIPRRVPTEPVHIEGIVDYASAADQRAANGEIDVPVGPHFVVHADGSFNQSDDLRVGGHLLTPALRAQAAASPDPDIRALADLSGRLPNSAGKTWDVAAGGAWIDGNSNAGLSVSHYDSLYGVPIRFSLDPAVPAEAPRIDIAQTRIDGRAEIATGSGLVDSVRFRGGWSHYRHFELEQNGDIGTAFYNNGFEGRLEAHQANRGGWGGGFGAQYYQSDLRVEGDEKFLPPDLTRQLGLFVLETLDRGPFKAEGGLRFEHSMLHADADADLGNAELQRNFDAVSGSVGASYAIAPSLRFGINLSRSERAPDVEELFANGPHAGTQAFEIGDPGLSTEKSWGVEATLRRTGDAFSFSASIFQNWFNGYIYDRQTGQIRDNLPVFQTSQADARYFGAEFEGSARLAEIGETAINLDGVADYVEATIHSQGPAPHIPPLRLLGGIEAQAPLATGRVEVEWVDRQDRVAALETPTDGYTMVNASLAVHPFGARNQSSITLAANNIFDVVARRHASFLKDYAPLAGRDIRISLRFMF
jgi:iron complex outermembrane receptor protein